MTTKKSRKAKPEATAPAANIREAVLAAVAAHPALMSPVLLEYLLRGEVIGRMAEKGLMASPHHGALAAVAPHLIHEAIAAALQVGHFTRHGGFYPSLNLTPSGAARLDEISKAVAL